MTAIVQHSLNGLSFGALLFMLASGFTLVFGLMRIVNLAHGAFYLAGGYVGVMVTIGTGNMLVGVLAGAAVVAAIAIVAELLLLRRTRGKELPEVLLTVGLSFVIADLCLAIFGGDPWRLPIPSFLSGTFTMFGISYPRYRLFIILVAIVIAIALLAVQRYTRVGAMVRAGVDDPEIVTSLGIDIKKVFTGMFVVGGAIAGMAGVLGSGMLSLRPGVEMDVLLYALVVVIIGGLGSIQGAIVGSVFIGLIDAFSKVYVPDFAYFTVFAPMALVLIFRPSGLFGKAGA